MRASVLDGYDAFLSRRGVRLEPLLKQHGLTHEDLTIPGNEISLNAVSAVMEAAAQAANDPCLGMAWAEAFPAGGSGVFGYLLMHSPTVREAMRAVARYADVFVKSVEARFEETPDGGGVLWWHFPVTMDPPRVQYASFSMAGIVNRLRESAGAVWHPMAVELEHRDLGCGDIAQRVLGPNVKYNAPRNAIHVDGHMLDRRLVSADPRLLVLMQELGDRILSERTADADIVTNTRKVIVDHLEMGASLESVAEALQLAPRSLQSKLSQSETSFEAILGETRRALAEHYLRDTDLILTEIAFLLGFSELSAFTRAAQRWFGVAPSVYRQQLRRATYHRDKAR